MSAPVALTITLSQRHTRFVRADTCLGHLTDALHMSPQTADELMKVILAYLLIGSYALLQYQWRKAQADVKSFLRVYEANSRR
ncbi:MAG: hypothetical protein HY298_05230 [Verrucomicrobia bacterium]|nr:hypothetical protein [Verrucomicrobiota bacterium]